MNVKISLNSSKYEKKIYVQPSLIFTFLILYSLHYKTNMVKEQQELDIEFPTRQSGKKYDSGFFYFFKIPRTSRKAGRRANVLLFLTLFSGKIIHK